MVFSLFFVHIYIEVWLWCLSGGWVQFVLWRQSSNDYILITFALFIIQNNKEKKNYLVDM